MVVQDGEVYGFGSTESIANLDLYRTKCIKNTSSDYKQIYKARRSQLLPWTPTPDSVHIGSMYIKKEKDKIISVIDGQSFSTVLTGDGKYDLYGMLSRLSITSILSFSDVAIVARDEINSFMKSINPGAIPAEEYPEVFIRGISDIKIVGAFMLSGCKCCKCEDGIICIQIQNSDEFYCCNYIDEAYVSQMFVYLATRYRELEVTNG